MQQYLMTHEKTLVDRPVNFLVPGVNGQSMTSHLVRAADQSFGMVCDIMLRPPGEKNIFNIFFERIIM